MLLAHPCRCLSFAVIGKAGDSSRSRQPAPPSPVLHEARSSALLPTAEMLLPLQPLPQGTVRLSISPQVDSFAALISPFGQRVPRCLSRHHLRFAPVETTASSADRKAPRLHTQDGVTVSQRRRMDGRHGCVDRGRRGAGRSVVWWRKKRARGFRARGD